jgi:hypothetical protein
MAQTVTFAPTCLCTVRKFCRNVVNETSAQVGRVATRLSISAVVATFAIIAGVARAPTLRWGYSRVNDMPRTRVPYLVSRQQEVHRNLCFHLNGLAIKNIRPISPLADGFNRRPHQHGWPRYRM